MNNRPTPETDAAWKEGNAIREWTCRKLERERDEAREDLEFRRGLYKVQEEYLETARRERDEAREDAERWQELYKIVSPY